MNNIVDKIRSNFYLIFVLAITLLAFINILPNQFCIDDHAFITDWPLIRSLSNFSQFFGPHNQPSGEEGVYSPLKTLFHALNYHFFGTNPIGYHLISILIHLLGTAFVYKITLKLINDESVALLSAIFFGLHPVHVEAITSVTGSVDSLGVVFMFISFYFYIFASEKGFGLKNYTLPIMFAFLAIFTHELTIILPLLFVFYEICFPKKGQDLKTISRKTGVFFTLSIVYILIKRIVLGSISRGGYLYNSFYLTMLVVIKALAKYVYILFFPFNLSINHELAPGIFSVDWQTFDRFAVISQSMFNFQLILSFSLIIILIDFAIKQYKNNSLYTFAIGWFFISLLPVSNIIPTGSYFTERYLYPGSFGFCVFIALFLCVQYDEAQAKNKIIKSTLIMLAVLLLSIFYFTRTALRNKDWYDYTTFLVAEAKMNPNHSDTQKDLGVYYWHKGEIDLAIKQLNRAIFLKADEADNYFILGQIYAAQNNYTQAISNYKTAIRRDRQLADAYYNLASVYAFLGLKEEARDKLNKAKELFKKQKREEYTKDIVTKLEKILAEDNSNYLAE